VQIEAVAEEDTVDSFVVHLQSIHNVRGSHIEHVFTCALKLSIKVSFMYHVLSVP